MDKKKEDFFNEEINLTDQAIKRIKAILNGENKKDHGLRISVVGGGCSGMSYNLSFDNHSLKHLISLNIILLLNYNFV